MARDLPASGRFTIPVEALAGGEVYARVEVDDPAGNTGEAQTPAPISVDGVTPAMQVHDLPPLDNSPTARGPRRYIFR